MHGGANAQPLVVKLFGKRGDSLRGVLAGEGLHIERSAWSAAGVATDASGERTPGTAATFRG